MTDVETTMYNILKLTRKHETMPGWALGLKLGEEVGEVQECILYESGFLQHKEMKEDVLHEVADVFNVCLGLLSQHYPTKSPELLMSELNLAMLKKNEKYEKLLRK